MRRFKNFLRILGGIAIVIFTYGFLNSNWLIIKVGEFKYSSVLEIGTSKSGVLNFLERKEFYISSPENYYRGDDCIWWATGNLRWDCQYPSYVFSRQNAGFFGITDPQFRIYFFFDENNQLAEYHSSVGHTFL